MSSLSRRKKILKSSCLIMFSESTQASRLFTKVAPITSLRMLSTGTMAQFLRMDRRAPGKPLRWSEITRTLSSKELYLAPSIMLFRPSILQKIGSMSSEPVLSRSTTRILWTCLKSDPKIPTPKRNSNRTLARASILKTCE